MPFEFGKSGARWVSGGPSSRPRAASTGGGGYDAASRGRRLAGFIGSGASVNALLIGSGDDLRAKSHKVVRENAWASGAIDSWTANAIGTGIIPQPLVEAGLKKSIKRRWSDSCDEMDAAGVTDYYGLQALAWRTMMEGGEAFIRLRARRPSDGLAVPLQLQILEADHVPLIKNEALGGGNTIRAGIEFDAIGRRVAYWMYPEHPQSGIAMFTADNQPKRVPANQVIHLFAPFRPGQIRGEPWLTRALVKLFNLDQWEDATLERQKLGAMLLAYITETAPEGVDPLLLSKPNLGADGQGEAAPDGIEFGKLEPGTILKMLMGEDLKFFEPPEVGQNYGAFNEQQQRWVAQSVKTLPYEDLTGDVSKVNYSSIRARNLAFRRACEQLQFGVMVFQFCRPVYNAWLDAAVLSGALDIPGYASNPREFRRCIHRTPKWAWVDPLKDAMAEIMLVDNLLKARSDVINEMGEDEDEIDARIAADQDRELKYGLVRRTKHMQTTLDTTSPDGTTPNRYL